MLRDYGDFADTQSLINSFKIYAEWQRNQTDRPMCARSFTKLKHADDAEKRELDFPRCHGYSPRLRSHRTRVDGALVAQIDCRQIRKSCNVRIRVLLNIHYKDFE